MVFCLSLLHPVLGAAPASSITESVTQLATSLVGSAGLAGIFVLMLLDCACIPVPSEVTMLFAGFNVSEHHYSLIAIILAGVLGNLAGSIIAYWIGRYGRDVVLGSGARRVLFHKRTVDRAQHWFDRYGSASVFFSRMLPLVRTFISLPAGFARMEFGRFCLFTTLGCIPWVLAWALIGNAVGHNWTQWRDHLRYVDYAVVTLAVAGLLWLLARRLRRRQNTT